MAQYVNARGNFTGSAGGARLRLTKYGDWDGVEILLHNLSHVPEAIKAELKEER